MKSIPESSEIINAKLYKYDNVHVSPNEIHQLAEEDYARYKQLGFLSAEGVLNEAEIEQSKQALADLLHVGRKGAKLQFSKPEKELRTPRERDLAIRKIHDFVAVEERLRRIAYHQDIIGTIRRIFGEEPKLIQDMALLKPPHGGGEKPWHQDMAYGNLTYTKAAVGVWIALDEATADNGCMHLIPGSHQEGATPHYAVRDWQLCDTQVPVNRDVIVPLQPGGVLFFHGMLYHGTPSNLSAQGRRALQFHYVPASAEKVSPQEYKRMFTNELSGAEC